MVQLCTSSGEVDAARAFLDEAMELGGERPSPKTQSCLEFAKALLFAERGEIEEADASFERAAQYQPEIHPAQLEISPSWIHLEHGRFLAATRRPQLAEEVLKRAREWMVFVHEPMRQAIEEVLNSIRS